MNTASPSVRRSRPSGFSALFLSVLGVVLLLPSITSAQLRSTIGSYQVSGPYHYKNLSVFLVHGKGTISGRNIMTLEEGLAQGIVKVYETGSVNELEIENLSNDVEIYIQAGDIVKGGRQDRTLGIDLTLAPNSGRVPIASFCVERGRWRQRGEESSVEFSSSNAVVTSNELRLAIKESKNQSDVWANVDVMQNKLSENIGVQVNMLGASVPAGEADADGGNEIVELGTYVLSDAAVVDGADLPVVQSEAIVAADILNGEETANRIITTDEILDEMLYINQASQSAMYRPNRIPAGIITQNQSRMLAGDEGDAYTTSLQLTLENTEVIEEVEEYMAALREIIEAHDDVIGFAFTINGEMRNADVYASGDLFERLWPKLLRAAATEAVSEQNGGTADVAGSIDAVRDCFLDAEGATAEEEEIDERMIMVTRRSEENVLFETQEKGEDEWLHRNYMKLEFE